MKKWLSDYWKRTPHQVRKPLIFILGFSIIGVGIILLPLPGPGWLIIFAGFAILATEFEFAERLKVKVVKTLKQVVHKLLDFWKKLTQKH